MADKNKIIKDFAFSNFFREENIKFLSRYMESSETVTDMMKMREFPYKYGIYLIIKDVKDEYCPIYHYHKKMRSGFEFLKILHDVLPLIDEEEKKYIQIKVNSYITKKSEDFTALLLELYLYYSFRKRGFAAKMGESENNPDVLVHYAGQDYNIQCKSLRMSLKERNSLRNIVSLLKFIHDKDDELTKIGCYTAWQLSEMNGLETESNFLLAKNRVQNFISFAKGELSSFDPDGPVLRLMLAIPGKSIGFFGFLTGVESEPTMQSVINKLLREVVAHAISEDTPWCFAFYREQDIETISKRAANVFSEAMDQHAANGAKNPIVAILIEEVNITDDRPEAGSGTVISEARRKKADVLAAAIEQEVKKKSSWTKCYGLEIQFAFSGVAANHNIIWHRARIWSSPNGSDVEKEFPPLSAQRGQL